MKLSSFFFIIEIIFLVSCGNPDLEIKNAAQKKPASLTQKVKKPVIIDIVPYTDSSLELSVYVYKKFVKIYPNTRLLKPIPLPHSAFYPTKSRYRADTLIRQLSAKTIAGHVTFALTTKDISCTHDGVADWGIFGLSYCPGKACVASIFRLKNNKEQFFKIAIHELGHTQGLNHCPVKTCFMRDAEGGNPTSQEKEFCPKCKKALIKAGWLL
jgi:archaemetzincin